MDQWICCNPDTSQIWWDGNMEDPLSGFEDQGWCLACGEFGHKEVPPAQKQKRRRGGRSRRNAREPVPLPASEREVLLAWVPESATRVLESETEQWSGWNPYPSRIRWDGGWEDLEDRGWCFICREFGHEVGRCPRQEGKDLPPRKQKRKEEGKHGSRRRPQHLRGRCGRPDCKGERSRCKHQAFQGFLQRARGESRSNDGRQYNTPYLRKLQRPHHALRRHLTAHRPRLTAQRHHMTARRRRLTAHSRWLTAQCHHLTARRRRLTAHSRWLTAQCHHLTARRRRLTAHSRWLTAQCHHLTARRRRLTAHSRWLTAQCHHLTARRRRLTAHSRWLTAQCHHLTARRRRLTAHSRWLTAQCHHLTARRRRLTAHSRWLTAQCHHLTARRRRLTAHSRWLTAQCHHLTARRNLMFSVKQQ
ncbi:UNVERIFIED_CONTAM: hypothetical protein FKN15_036773 [Acipenser sinensis]